MYYSRILKIYRNYSIIDSHRVHGICTIEWLNLVLYSLKHCRSLVIGAFALSATPVHGCQKLFSITEGFETLLAPYTNLRPNSFMVRTPRVNR